ncbi:hypothetical protein SteCoe_17945 [Stentor coeruleus]|uniref:Receptor ligand binding region domain-containing protein n=1 Tax=Stentor coeruleus TaxID=5963 RepID=A0A1R2BXL1_9CILI|nr:hypothetical protein SteCoe_17945 [Stentor coeruleus]
MISFILFFVTTALGSSDIKFLLLTSEFTSKELNNNLDSNIHEFSEYVQVSLKLDDPVIIIPLRVSLSELPWTLPEALFEKSIQIILDATNNVFYSEFLSENSFEKNFLHIVLSRPQNKLSEEVFMPNTLYTEPSSGQQAQILHSLILNFGWKNLGIIHDLDENNIQIASEFRSLIKTPQIIHSELILDSKFSITEINARIKSTIGFSQSRVIIIITSSSLAELILTVINKGFMGGPGFTWILSNGAMMNLNEILKNSNSQKNDDELRVIKTGILGIQIEDAVFMSQNPLYEYLAMLCICASGYMIDEYPTGTSLMSYITENPYINILPYQLYFDDNGVRVSKYHLLNMQNFVMIEIGSWGTQSYELQMNENVQILWPGMRYEIPSDEIISLPLVFLYPSDDFSESTVKNGFNFAISEINTLQILGNNKLEGQFIQTQDNLNIVSGVIKQIKTKYPIGLIGPWGNEAAMSYANSINNMTNPIPLVSYQASDYTLNNTSKYPYFIRTIQSDSLQSSIIAAYLQKNNWQKTAVIYTSDNIGEGQYINFLDNLKTYDISIENDEKYRKIVYKLDEQGNVMSETITSLKESLMEIVRKQLKIIIYFGGDTLTPYLAREADKKELRGEEFIWIGGFWITENTLSVINTTFSEDSNSIFRVLNGAIALGLRPALGTIGENFISNYLKSYNQEPSQWSILVYDTVYLYAYSIKRMIDAGEDYTNGTSLLQYIRSSDFTGATGSLSFSEGRNDRTLIGYSILNLQNGQLIRITQYDPINQFSNDNITVLYGYHTTTRPDDTWGTVYNCPFPEIMSNLSGEGFGIIAGISSGLFILTLLLSIFYYRSLQHEDMNQLSKKTKKSWKDTLVQLTIAVEFFQFLAIAPYFKSLQMVIEVISNMFMFDFMKITQADKKYYWDLLSGICALCYVWFVLMILTIIKGENWVKKLPVCKKAIEFMNSYFLPFFGNTMFLPALALLLDAFVCDHQALGSSYVWRDCYMTCWGTDHIKYVIISGFAIFLYEPLAVICRPIWQLAKTDLHIKTRTLFLLLKTCLQIFLISLGKILQGSYPLAHGIIFSLFILVFAGATYKYRAFNYPRCDLWQISSLIAVAYLSILATISMSADQKNIGWFIGLALGWVVIVAVTFYLQHKYFPVVLYSHDNDKNGGKVFSIHMMEKIAINEKDKDNKNPKVPQEVCVIPIAANVENINQNKAHENNPSEENEANPI